MSDIRKRPGKNGPTYQVRYAAGGATSGFSYKTFATLKEARQFRESSKESVARPDDMTVGKAVDMWLHVCKTEGRDGRPPVSDATYKFYAYIAGFMRSYPWPASLGKLTKPDVVAFRSWLVAEHGRYLAAKTLTYFHGVLAEMGSRGHVDSNVAVGVKVQQETRYSEPIIIPTPDEIRDLLQAADDLARSTNEQTKKTWERYRPMLYLAVDSGMRPQEHVAVARKSFDKHGVYVEQAIDASGNLSVPKTMASRRFIELSPVTLDLVQNYIEAASVKNDYDLVFPTAGGKWQSLSNWRKRCFDAACLHAEITETANVDGKKIVRPRYSPYALRHYFASVLIAQGTDIAKIKTLMGHTDISTTFDVYAHLIRRAEDKRSRRVGMIASTAEIPV